MVTKFLELVKCNNCTKDFYKSPTEIKRSKTGKHYCSRSCSASKNNLFVQKNKPIKFVCTQCNIIFTRNYKNRSNKICLQCKEQNGNYQNILTNTIKNQTIKEYCVSNNVHPSWRFARIRGLNRSWNKQLTNNPCQVCGYKTHVELAHIKPLHSFKEHSLLSEVNNPNNILVLCPNHHWEFDNGGLLLEQIPKRV
jgi:hypothetical protein